MGPDVFARVLTSLTVILALTMAACSTSDRRSTSFDGAQATVDARPRDSGTLSRIDSREPTPSDDAGDPDAAPITSADALAQSRADGSAEGVEDALASGAEAGTVSIADAGGAPAPAEFACLNDAQRVRSLRGQFDTTFKTTVMADEAIDARQAHFVVHRAMLGPAGPDVEVNSQNAVWIPKGPAGGCWAGGLIESDYSRCSTFHDNKATDPGAVSWGQPGFKVQGVAIRNIEDDLRPHDGADIIFPGLSPANTKFNPADDFDVSSVWTEYIRGDCFENDGYAGGRLRDSLFDGCNAWMSETPGVRLARLPPEFHKQAIEVRNMLNGQSKTVLIDKILLRMSAMPYPNTETAFGKVTVNGIPYGGGPFFKVLPRSPRLVVTNSIFVFDPLLAGTDTFDFPETITSCSNNVIVWLGAGDFPGRHPDCFRVTKDVNVWKAAVRDWHARHPNVGKAWKPPVEKMGEIALVSCN